MVMSFLAGLMPKSAIGRGMVGGGLAGFANDIWSNLDTLLPDAGRGVGGFLPGRSTRALPGAAGEGGGPSGTVVNQWNTGTATFYQLQNGKIGTFKRNGVWKEWRPYKPVVVPKKWSSRSMARVATALKRQRKVAGKVMQLTGGYPGASAAQTARKMLAERHHAGGDR